MKIYVVKIGVLMSYMELDFIIWFSKFNGSKMEILIYLFKMINFGIREMIVDRKVIVLVLFSCCNMLLMKENVCIGVFIFFI